MPPLAAHHLSVLRLPVPYAWSSCLVSQSPAFASVSGFPCLVPTQSHASGPVSAFFYRPHFHIPHGYISSYLGFNPYIQDSTPVPPTCIPIPLDICSRSWTRSRTRIWSHHTQDPHHHTLDL
ncbi:hypothetical protein BD311DRAFT_751569 [Dichomitus squalens]|uniref:Uncharacterized protein n=1 Tax=Dichomitus squalens TaxID=114155 RepID=A0A4Q9MVP6_9APHY|nr:hypothetical protein BD311DRAFT_751569 [Dichomitus squalens]